MGPRKIEIEIGIFFFEHREKIESQSRFFFFRFSNLDSTRLFARSLTLGQMMALYESEESESLNETLVAQGVARVASNADRLATSQVCVECVYVCFFHTVFYTHLLYEILRSIYHVFTTAAAMQSVSLVCTIFVS